MKLTRVKGAEVAQEYGDLRTSSGQIAVKKQEKKVGEVVYLKLLSSNGGFFLFLKATSIS